MSCFNMAESLYNAGEFSSAIENYRLVWREDSNYANAQAKLLSAMSKLKQSAIEESNLRLENKNFEGAINVIDSALNIIGNDADLVQQRTHIETSHINEIIAQANTLSWV